MSFVPSSGIESRVLSKFERRQRREEEEMGDNDEGGVSYLHISTHLTSQPMPLNVSVVL